jgi:hypothetical protein
LIVLTGLTALVLLDTTPESEGRGAAWTALRGLEPLADDFLTEGLAGTNTDAANSNRSNRTSSTPHN